MIVTKRLKRFNACAKKSNKIRTYCKHFEDDYLEKIEIWKGQLPSNCFSRKKHFFDLSQFARLGNTETQMQRNNRAFALHCYVTVFTDYDWARVKQFQRRNAIMPINHTPNCLLSCWSCWPSGRIEYWKVGREKFLLPTSAASWIKMKERICW